MALQAGKIKNLFQGSVIPINPNKLVWKYSLIPSPLSNTYEIKLVYIKGQNPNVYVLNPKLALHPNATKLPHVYDTNKQWLCLYYRKAREWKSSMLLAETIIPWTCEWLFHYEVWLSTGEWHGGGIVHETEAEKQTEKHKGQTIEN